MTHPPGHSPLTVEQYSRLRGLLASVHDYFHQLLGVLYVMEPPHTNNDLVKCLRPNALLDKTTLAAWRLDADHGLLHGLLTAYFAVKLANGWTIPVLRNNVDMQRLIASCLVHDYARLASGIARHDEHLADFFRLLLPDTYRHSRPASLGPLVQADRIESLRHQDRWRIDAGSLHEPLPHDTAIFEVWAFYRFIRPAMARLFRGRTEVWLRHGAEESDWRNRWPEQPMVSRSKELWPNFYLPWPGFADYWAIEVGEITPTSHKKPLVDFFFPCGLMTLDDYRACEERPSIVSADGREHEIAHGHIPIDRWIFVFDDQPLEPYHYLVAGSGGFVTAPILTTSVDVADALYAKLASIG
jgi:hypothetical protein